MLKGFFTWNEILFNVYSHWKGNNFVFVVENNKINDVSTINDYETFTIWPNYNNRLQCAFLFLALLLISFFFYNSILFLSVEYFTRGLIMMSKRWWAKPFWFGKWCKIHDSKLFEHIVLFVSFGGFWTWWWFYSAYWWNLVKSRSHICSTGEHTVKLLPHIIYSIIFILLFLFCFNIFSDPKWHEFSASFANTFFHIL